MADRQVDEPRELPGAWNFRDVAEATAGLRPGRLFRSSELSSLTEDGRAMMRRLGITDVADLRSSREVARRGPGQVPYGVDIHLLPVPDLAPDDAENDGSETGEAPHETAFKRMLTNGQADESDEAIEENAARYMAEDYAKYPTRPGTQRAVRQVFTLLAAGRPVLTHCFAGKDRTGFVIAMVLEAAGLDRDAIVADYLRSNDAVPYLRSRITDMIEHRSDAELTPEVVTFTKARLSNGVLGVRAEYLQSAWRTIDECYGSQAGYLREMGITEAEVTRLRRALRG